MSIFVSVEDRDGELKGDVIDIRYIQKKFGTVPDSRYLRFITEDIDTRFNRYQVPFLAEELEKLRVNPLTPEEDKELEQLLNYAKKVNKNKNLHLNFYGDKE